MTSNDTRVRSRPQSLQCACLQCRACEPLRVHRNVHGAACGQLDDGAGCAKTRRRAARRFAPSCSRWCSRS